MTLANFPRVRDDAMALLSRPILGLGHWIHRSWPDKQSALFLRFVTSSENHWAGLLRAICFLLNVQTQMHTFATCFAIAEAKAHSSAFNKGLPMKAPSATQTLCLRLKGTKSKLRTMRVVCQGFSAIFYSCIMH